MKRLWIAVGIIALFTGLTLGNTGYLNQFTRSQAQTLAQAQACAERNDWDRAARLTEQARLKFERHSFYLHVTLRHGDIDAIEVAFQEVLEFLTHPEQMGEYTAANARLMAQLELLSEGELPTIKNIL